MQRLFVIACLLFAGSACAQNPAVFLSTYAAQDHVLNADPDSAFWKDTPQITMDKVITGEPDTEVKELVRSRWTRDKLYFLFIGPYDVLDLQPNPDTVNETYKLWFHDVFEMDLGANFGNINLYGEFQMSPQGEFADLGIDATKAKPGWNDERLWSSGMKVKARIDKEKKIWYGEMSVPIASLDKRPATAGNLFRINFYRLHTVPNETKRHFIAWQPTGVWNPHKPEKFGALKLVQSDSKQ
jgi:hypothetical protein